MSALQPKLAKSKSKITFWNELRSTLKTKIKTQTSRTCSHVLASSNRGKNTAFRQLLEGGLKFMLKVRSGACPPSLSEANVGGVEMSLFSGYTRPEVRGGKEASIYSKMIDFYGSF